MTDKSLVKIAYDEPNIPGTGVGTQDDVVSILHKENLLKTRVYPGSVHVSGIPRTVFPFKWSVSKINTGHYRITHNLGHIKYVVVTTPTDVTADTDLVISNITTKTAAYVDITWSSIGAATINQYFDFILIALL